MWALLWHWHLQCLHYSVCEKECSCGLVNLSAVALLDTWYLSVCVCICGCVDPRVSVCTQSNYGVMESPHCSRKHDPVAFSPPYTYTHSRSHTHRLYFKSNLLLIHSLSSHIHMSCAPRPIVGIISFSDRWKRSDLLKNEATNLHPYYTGAHTLTYSHLLDHWYTFSQVHASTTHRHPFALTRAHYQWETLIPLKIK